MADNYFHVATWQDAEHNAARWMSHWGYSDAQVTAGGADGGIDVVSSHAVAQVKFKAQQVGGPDIQRLAGAGFSHPGKQLIFFTGTSYSSNAFQVAEDASVALFTYALNGDVSAANAMAAYIETPGQESQRAAAAQRFNMTRSNSSSLSRSNRGSKGLIATFVLAIVRFYKWLFLKFIEFSSEVIRVVLHKLGRTSARFPAPTKSTYFRAGGFLLFMSLVVLIGGISSTTDPASTASHTQKVWAVIAEAVGGGALPLLGALILLEGCRTPPQSHVHPH